MLMNHFFKINFANALIFRTTYVCPLLHNWILISFGTDSDSLLLSILTHSIFAMAGITYFYDGT